MKRKLVIFFSLILVVIGGAVLHFIPKTLLPINDITCSVQGQSCPIELTSPLQALRGKSLFFTQIENEVAHLNLEFYQLVSVRKKLPSTLELDFEPRKNIYVLTLAQTGERLIVAETGRVQSAPDSTTLTTITVAQGWASPLVDDHVDTHLHQVCQTLITSLQEKNVAFTTITINSSQEIEVFLANGQRALLSAEQIQNQVEKLAIIQKNVDTNTIDTGIRTIDVRFSLPVLKTQ